MSKRPVMLTDTMRMAAALKVAAHVKRDCHDMREESLGSLARDIAKVGRYDHFDGYEMAKRLDQECGWSPDSMMVDALDAWSSEAGAEIQNAQRAWRDETNPQPSFALGDRVRIRDGDTGEVTEVDYKYGVAQCLVKVDGDPQADTSQARRIVEWEDVEVLASAPPESVTAIDEPSHG